MSAVGVIQIEEVIELIQENGGKLTNNDLVRSFKKYLANPEHAERNKKRLKEFTNKVAMFQKVDDVKLILLQPRFANLHPHEIIEILNHEENARNKFTRRKNDYSSERRKAGEAEQQTSLQRIDRKRKSDRNSILLDGIEKDMK